MENVQSFEIWRWRGEEAPRSMRVVKSTSGGWRTGSPHRGEADPDALAKLFFILDQPEILSSRAEDGTGPDAGTTLSFAIELTGAHGAVRRIEVQRAPLGQPIPVRIRGVGSFVVSPIEFANKIPDPSEFLPPGLWVTPSSADATLTVAVRGRVSYRLKAVGAEEWVSLDGRTSPLDLEDVAGTITGRVAVSHPEPWPLASFGLDPPQAVATLCIRSECREFKFGSAVREGRELRFAVGPDQDPIELSDQAWRLVVDGPFQARAK